MKHMIDTPEDDPIYYVLYIDISCLLGISNEHGGHGMLRQWFPRFISILLPGTNIGRHIFMIIVLVMLFIWIYFLQTI